MSSVDATHLDLRVLGAVQLLRDGSSVGIGGPKQRGVLAMLVLAERQPVSVARLIDGIWGPEPPVGARGVIHTYIAELRRALGSTWRSALQTVGDGYRLQLPTDATDLERFGDLASCARDRVSDGDLSRARQLLTDAIAESRGEPLGDLTDLPFAGPAQLRLTELVTNAREEALEIDLALGNAGSASVELSRLVAEQPYRERLWELLALARHQHGRQVEALDAISRARRLLRDEMGIVPNPRLAQIELAILRQEPTEGFLTIRGSVEHHERVRTLASVPAPEPQPEDPPSRPPTVREGRQGVARHVGRHAAVVILVAVAVAVVVVLTMVLRNRPGPAPIAAAGHVGAVNASSGELLASIELGRSIVGIVVGEDHVFATEASGRVIVQIDPRRRIVTRSFALDGEPWRPRTAHADVFVPIGAGKVARLDTTTGLVEQPIEPLGTNPGRVEIVDVGDRAWAIGTNGDIGVLDESGGAVVPHTLPVGVQRVVADDRIVWAVTDERLVELVSLSPRDVLSRATLRGTGVDITVGLDSVWVVTADDNRLWRADRNTGEVLGTLTLPATPSGVVTTNDTVWVSTASGQLLAIDAAGERITKTIDLEQPIATIAYGHSTIWVGFV